MKLTQWRREGTLERWMDYFRGRMFLAEFTDGTRLVCAYAASFDFGDEIVLSANRFTRHPAHHRELTELRSLW